MTTLAQKTTGHLIGPGGAIIEQPTTILDADTAKLIRDYFYWTLTHGLQPELFCNTCTDHTRDAKAIYNISEHEIEIICRCGIRYFKGEWIKPLPMAATMKAQTTDTTGPIHVALSGDEALLLRRYKKVLLELGLKEALRCNTCYKLNLPDGCEAQVLTNSIRIRCRCSDRTYFGMTI